MLNTGHTVFHIAGKTHSVSKHNCIAVICTNLRLVAPWNFVKAIPYLGR